MNELTALVDRNSGDWTNVELLLRALDYRVHFAQTLEEVQRLAKETGCRVVILDLDLVQIPNRFFRSLKKSHPDLTVLATSSRSFHPELREALTHHICACFRKPIVTEEVEFWLKTVETTAPARDPTNSTVR